MNAEDVVESKLQPALSRVLERRHQIEQSIHEYELLRERLTEHQHLDTVADSHENANRGYDIVTEIGEGAAVRARISDSNTVVVDIGLGVLPVFSKHEAVRHAIPHRIAQLKQQADRLDERAARIRADITVANQAIRQLHLKAGRGDD
eukprot:gb/GECG01009479.1/.p1 GENE.gb/GECG01009479.1/~~gb/GECG01009479.1/.p1  ORF type:complete len:148 (+),score=22.81 gb/GECG01009479.1/:1-444(+)